MRLRIAIVVAAGCLLSAAASADPVHSNALRNVREGSDDAASQTLKRLPGAVVRLPERAGRAVMRIPAHIRKLPASLRRSNSSIQKKKDDLDEGQIDKIG